MGSGGKRVTTAGMPALAQVGGHDLTDEVGAVRGGGEGVSLVTVAALLTHAWQERRLAAAHHTPGGVGWRARI